MTPEDAVALGQQAIFTVGLVSGPVLLAALVVGASVSIIQAVTQVQEMTLVFVPKIIVVFIVMMVMSGWMMDQAVTFGTRCFESAAEFGR